MSFKRVSEAELNLLVLFHNQFSDYVVLDLETTGLDPFKDTITDIVVSGVSPDEVVLAPGTAIRALKELNKPLVLQNFKFDFHMAYRAGVDLRHQGLKADIMLLDHLIDENVSHGLDDMVQRHYQDNYKEIFWGKYKTYEDASEEDKLEYACKDVYYTRQIYIKYLDLLNTNKIPESLVEHVHKLAKYLYTTEITGIKLDLPYLHNMATVLTQKISDLKVGMRSLVDSECQQIELAEYFKALAERKTEKGKLAVKKPEFNFDSSKQLVNLLYNKLGLPIQRSKTKAPTVDDGALDKLEDKHRVIPLIREYRTNQKLYTAFIEGNIDRLKGDRIYPGFNVNGTVTGRISSSNPNMQQLPKDGGIRGIYIPSEGCKFISADYSQLEVTLAAHFSRDKNLLSIVYDGLSQHDITAKGLGIPRDKAKTINFAMQYGAGAKKIQAVLGCSERDAELALKKYWDTYAGLASFIKECHIKVEKGIPLVNPFGRQRRFPTQFEDKWALERAKRQAANSLIQGTGADITNKAFYEIGRFLGSSGIGRALFPIHDEILIEVLDTHASIASEALTTTMVDVGKSIGLSVPLSVSCSTPMDRWSKG